MKNQDQVFAMLMLSCLGLTVAALGVAQYEKFKQGVQDLEQPYQLAELRGPDRPPITKIAEKIVERIVLVPVQCPIPKHKVAANPQVKENPYVSELLKGGDVSTDDYTETPNRWR